MAIIPLTQSVDPCNFLAIQRHMGAWCNQVSDFKPISIGYKLSLIAHQNIQLNVKHKTDKVVDKLQHQAFALHALDQKSTTSFQESMHYC